MRRWVQLMIEHRKMAMLTFEIFWILVALLEAASKPAGAQIVQFVYVNF